MGNWMKFWLGIAVGVSAMLITGAIETQGLFSEAAGSWAQAVGGIGAVWAAYWFGSQQIRREQRRASHLRVQISDLGEAIDAALAQAVLVPFYIEANGTVPGVRRDLEMFTAMLDAFPAFEVEGHRIQSTVAGIRMALGNAIALVRRIEEDASAGIEMRGTFPRGRTRLEFYVELFEGYRKDIRGLIAGL